MFEAAISPYTTSEKELSAEVIAQLAPGMLCLADRGFYSFVTWTHSSATGADLLWRVENNLNLDPLGAMADGASVAVVVVSARARASDGDGQVRVVAYA